MVDKWDLKNNSESENVQWIIANTKNCPNCKRPIEKNHGCNHMECRSCKYGFCWICLGKWSEHNNTSGGYYKCNKFVEENSDKDKKRETAKNELNKYLFYFDRYNNHQKSEKHALELIPVMKLKMKQLHDHKKYP